MSLYESFCDDAFPRGYRQAEPVKVGLWTVQALGGGLAEAHHFAFGSGITVYAPAQNRVVFTDDDGLGTVEVPLRVVLALLDHAGFRVDGYRGRRTAPSAAHAQVDGWVLGPMEAGAAAMRMGGGGALVARDAELVLHALNRRFTGPALVQGRYDLDAVVATLVASGWEIAPR